MTRKMLKEEDEGESGQSTVVPSKALKNSLLLFRRELKSSEPIQLFQFPGQVNLAHRCTIFLCHLDLEIYQYQRDNLVGRLTKVNPATQPSIYQRWGG